MAFSLSASLLKCTAAQRDSISEQRIKLGFHCYYTGGLDARKSGIYVILPSLMENGNKLTVFFEFIGDTSNDAGIYLGRVNQSTVTYAALDFTDHYAFSVMNQGSSTSVQVNNITTPVQGPHVLQYSAVNNKIQVHLDGALLVPADSIKDNIWEHIVLSLGPAPADLPDDKRGPFVFHELHYTMVDPGGSVRRSAAVGIPEYKPNFFFSQWVRLGRGGFILFDGEWVPGSEVTVMRGAVTVMKHTAPPERRMTILIKAYLNGISVTYQDGGSNPSQFHQTAPTFIVRLSISNFDKIFEYKAVSIPVVIRTYKRPKFHAVSVIKTFV
ncbi:uncharacterized protein LOC144130148 [Amblyomma americanum]